MKLINKKLFFIGTPVVFILVVVVWIWWNFAAQRISDILPTVSPDTQPITFVAQELEIPWALDFLPDGSIVFSERPGRVRLVNTEGELASEPLLDISNLRRLGEGGLLGLAVHPQFTQNQFIYLYYTYEQDGSFTNRVEQYRMQNNRLTAEKIIIDRIPGAIFHNGGRIKFGPDGFLYITTGDAREPSLAQELSSLAGKILRLEDDGTIPQDNPFPNSPIYSFGHRNPQGLAWDSQGRLWSTEHGANAKDEINLIEPGKNYGWPEISGDQQNANTVSPIIESGKQTWAPSGAAFLGDSLFFVGLRGQSLYELIIKVDQPAIIQEHFSKKFGRLRDVVLGPDNFLYLLTSNRDGRGLPKSKDDQIIRIDPTKL